MGMPDHLTCLLRNLCAGQEATVRTGHGTADWFQIGKGVRQGCILSPYLFNLYAEYIMRNAGLEEAQAGVKIAGRGWDGWMASLTQWTWVWVNSRSWWWTGRPGVLQSTGFQTVGHEWVTELNQKDNNVSVILAWGFPGGSVVKKPPANAGDSRVGVWSLGREDPLEKELGTHSSILAWASPWMEEPGRLHTIHGLTKRHDLSTKQ